MLRLNPPTNPTALVLSAAAGCASRASLVAGCAIVSLGEMHMPLQRVELSRISPAAFHDGLSSDKLDRSVASARDADVIVVVAPVAGAAYSGLLPAWLDRLPEGALKGKVVVPLLLGGVPEPLARFESALRRRLEALGAEVSLGELFDASADFTDASADRAVAQRVDRAVGEALLRVRAGGDTAPPVSVIQADVPELIAC